MRACRKQREVLCDDRGVPQALTGSLAANRLFRKRQRIYRLLATDFGAALKGPMTIEHPMSKDPTSILTSTSAEDIAKVIEKDRFRHLLVCDRRGKLVGIISDRNVLRQGEATIREMMTREPITLQSNSLISLAGTLMFSKHVSCRPVVDEEGRPCAVVTTTDLIMTLQCMIQILHSAAPEVATPDDASGQGQAEAGDHNPTESKIKPTPAILQKADSTA